MRRPHAPPSRDPSWRLGALSSRHPHHAPRASFGLRAQALAAVALLALVALRPALVDRAGSAVATRRARAGVTVWQEGDVAADGVNAAAASLPGHSAVTDTAAAASTASLRNNDADDLLAALSDGALDLDALAAELDSDRGDAAAARVGAVKTTTNGAHPAGDFASASASASASRSIDDVSEADVLEALASLGDLDGMPKQQQPRSVGVGGVKSAAATTTSPPFKKASPLDDIDLDALAAAVLEEMEAEESAKAKAALLKPAAMKPSFSAIDPGSDTPLAGGDPLMQSLDGGNGVGSTRVGAASSTSPLDDLDDLEDDYDDDYDDEYDDDLDLLDGVAAVKAVAKPAADQPVPVAAVQPAAAAAAHLVPVAAVQPAAVAPLAVKPVVVAKPAAAAAASSSSSAQPPVRILMMNRFYFGDRYARTVPQCSWGGEPLRCEFFADKTQVADADAIA